MLIYGLMRTTYIQINAKFGNVRVLLIQTIVRLAWLAFVYHQHFILLFKSTDGLSAFESL